MQVAPTSSSSAAGSVSTSHKKSGVDGSPLAVGSSSNSATPGEVKSSTATPTTNVSSSSASTSIAQETYFSLWDLEGPQLDEWVRSVPTLFPKPKSAGMADSNATGGDEDGAKKETAVPFVTSSSSQPTYTPEELQRLELVTVAWNNLQMALQALHVVVEDLPSATSTSSSSQLSKQKQNGQGDGEDGEDDEAMDEPDTKRTKVNNTTTATSVGTRVHYSSKPKKKLRKKKKKTTKTTIVDPYNVYVHTIRRNDQDSDDRPNPKKRPSGDPLVDEDDDNHHDEADDEDDEEYAQDISVSTMGGKLSKLTSSGIINGLAGQLGGVVTTRHGTPLPGIQASTTPLSTVHNATLRQLRALSSAFCHAIQTRMETDVLITTPIRIQQMLAPEAALSEFKSIRRRVYDTVILGKGMGHQAGLAAEELDIPTGPAMGVHDVEKSKKCKSCGNNDQSLFVLDRKNGDVICSNCGTVASESLMHEGSQFRKFEGEADRNHHGDSANPLYSNAHNMGTTLGGIQMTPGAGGSGAGGGGFGCQKRGLETILRNAHAYTEMNISQFGKGDRRTRTGYKDKQKKDAFLQMTHCGDALNLHEAVVQRAKEIFAGFRDDRELIQQFKGVVAACLCEAFDQLSSAGRQILKQKLEQDDTATKDEEELAADEVKSNRAKFTHSSRANRRKELHHANLAGKGGLLLDFSAMPQQVGPGGGDDAKRLNGGGDGDAPAQTAASPSAGGTSTVAIADKVASSWELDDCRSWLLEASRTIAQKWIQDQKNGKVVVNNNSSSSTAPTIPKGTSQEELEGRMVEHAITLCDLLEAELKAEQQQQQQQAGGKKKVAVVTPRIKEMGILGIKWQHSHERGSGGKGGVGNSGKAFQGTNPTAATLTTTNNNNGLKSKATTTTSSTSSSNTTSSIPGRTFQIAGPAHRGGPGGGGRTAGQILILKTAKTLGNMLKDSVAGNAFHAELRALVGHQAALKRKEIQAESTRQRLTQMQRKPYLQARAQL
jgi:hypothetical protein